MDPIKARREGARPMAIIKLFADRERERLGTQAPDVFLYDELPKKVCVQIVHIWTETIGVPHEDEGFTSSLRRPGLLWDRIFQVFIKALGVMGLNKQGGSYAQCCAYILDPTQPENDRLSLVEIVCQVIDELPYLGQTQRQEAIKEINQAFRINRVGFSYSEGQLIRIDSEFVHSEIVLSALALLARAEFKGANDEFLRAHDHYRKGLFKEAIVEANKAFESTLKTILHGRGVPYDEKDTAKPLLDKFFSSEILPPEFNSLRSALESGVPTIRNKMGGHGQGAEIKNTPPHVVGLALHLAAANIVFLVESYLAKAR